MNKKAIVTGGSDGVGKAIVIKLGSLGYDVITNGRDAKKLDKTKSEFEAVSEGKIFTFTGDLAATNGISSFVSFCKNTFDTIDVLVNNAGLQIGNNLLEAAKTEDIEYMLKVHLYTPLALFQAYAEKLKEQKYGTIINIGTQLTGFAKETYGPYTISKLAEMGLTRALVKEYTSYGIKITDVILGGSDTNLRTTPRPEYLKPIDIAQAIVALINMPKTVYIPELKLMPAVDLLR